MNSGRESKQTMPRAALDTTSRTGKLVMGNLALIAEFEADIDIAELLANALLCGWPKFH